MFDVICKEKVTFYRHNAAYVKNFKGLSLIHGNQMFRRIIEIC